MDAVAQAFQQHPDDIAGFHNAVRAHFKALHEQHGNAIPDLNSVPVGNVASGSVVRFRCMVQNMRGPEYYCHRFALRDANGNTVAGTSSYRDHVVPEDGLTLVPDEATIQERDVIVCIPPPGESEWVTKQCGAPVPPHVDSGAARSGASNKRRRQDDDQEMNEGEEEKENEEAKGQEGAMPPPPQPRAVRARAQQAVGAGDGANAADEIGKCCFPLMPPNRPTTLARACLVKVYDPEFKPKIGELVEVVGVVEMGVGYDEDGGLCDPAVPSSMMPRVHCVLARALGTGFPDVPPQPMEQHGTGRAALVGCLRQVLGGDGLAAEYTLLTMLSRVSGRFNASPIGSVCVNLMTGANVAPLQVGTGLATVASAVLPRVVHAPLTINSLNTTPFVPAMNHDRNLLCSGVLQMAPRTFFVVDETSLGEGKLNETGVKALRGIQQLIANQSVGYDFQFHSIDFHTDVMSVVVSQGKSMVQPHIRVRMQPESAPQLPDGSAVAQHAALWQFLAARAHNTQPEVSEAMAKTIEDDYVAERQRNPHIGQDTLSLWLTLARLLASSHGDTELTNEHWQQVKQLEAARTARLAQK